MGSQTSKEKLTKLAPSTSAGRSEQIDGRLIKAFSTMAKGRHFLTVHDFTGTFGEDLGSDLWKFLTDGGTEKYEMEIQQFAKKAALLIGSGTDSYLELLGSAEQILKVCAEAAGIDVYQGDQTFVNVITKVMKEAEKTQNLASWIRSNCHRLCESVQSRVLKAFDLETTHNEEYLSDILSQFEMWFVKCSLPAVYFSLKKEDNIITEKRWTRLYTSMEHGISVTRFETNLFDYRGSTVAIFRLKDNQLFVLAMEKEWKNSGVSYTSPNSVLIKLLPDYCRVENPTIYCNFKIRNSPMKLSLDRYAEIDKEMNNVIGFEVYGCSNIHVLEEQQKQKERQRRQVEYNQKVPLPGNWDDNPDKYLLELGGVYCTDNRREIIRRDEEEKQKD